MRAGGGTASTLPLVAAVVLAGALSPAPPASAAGSPSVAALQVALARDGVYTGTVDGVVGRATTDAVRRFQARHRLVPDGIAGPRTLRALGASARDRLGRRVLHRRDHGWDVAELQFALAWAGFPSGAFDGSFGEGLENAVRRFQRFAGLVPDGRVGPGTLAALRRPPVEAPRRLAWPVAGELGDAFGPRGNRFHAGIDVKAPFGAPVRAAAAGRVVWAADRGDWGLLVTVAHGDGVRTLYAHLERIAVRLGDTLAQGSVVGRVGATGDATGPHLHFEVRVRGAAVDPVTALVP